MEKYTIKEKQISLDDSWDVVIVGGGPSGCAAAISAAREGAKTLLVEATGALGGMGTSGLVPSFYGLHDGEKIIAKGIAETVMKACRDNTPHLQKVMTLNPLYAPTINPELLKRIYEILVTKAKAKILFNTQLCSVENLNTEIVDTLIVSNKGGLTALKAKVCIDCTGDGDLAAWAGASFEKGDENCQLQPTSLCFIIGNVDEYGLNNGPQVNFFDPNSPIHKIIKSDDYPFINELHACCIPIGPRTVGFNAGHIHDVDNTNADEASQALMYGRELAAQYQSALAEYSPAFRNSHLVATGNLLGVRETRRIIGDYVLTIDDYKQYKDFEDEICRNAYGIDIHRSKEEEINLAQKNLDEIKQDLFKSCQSLPKGKSLGVPYRCLTPKGLKNVLVAGRCISTDRSVNGSVRIMACCLNTGEAAGIAAAIACTADYNVHNVNTDDLRNRLKLYGAYIPDRSAN